MLQPHSCAHDELSNTRLGEVLVAAHHLLPLSPVQPGCMEASRELLSCLAACLVLAPCVMDPVCVIKAQPSGAPAVCCMQIAFVEACLALDRLKPAARAVRQLGLVPEFPNVEAMYRQRSLTRLMNKRLWPVAQSYAGNDVALQVGCVAACRAHFVAS